MKKCPLFFATPLLAMAMITNSFAAPAKPPAPLDAADEATIAKYEKTAADDEAALDPFRVATDDLTVSAVEGAQIRIDAIRSVRPMLAAMPTAFKFQASGMEGSLKLWQAGVEYFTNCAKEKKDAFAGMLSGIRTVRSPIDGQLLFYKFNLPDKYNPGQKYPVSIDLHAGAALTWHALWMDGAPSSAATTASHDGVIHISPDGRGNSSYAAMGELAVLQALDHLKAHYAVDADRVRIGGASMGGTGALRFAAFYPEYFAAVHCLTGCANYGQPVGNPLIDPTLSIENVNNVAVCQWFEPGDLAGERGKTCQRWIDEIEAGAKEYPGQYLHKNFTDPKGHHGGIDKTMVAEGFAWVDAQVRNPFPHHVIYKTYTLRRDGAYWAHMDTLDDAAKPGTIDATLKDDGSIAVKTENVGRFHLELSHNLLGNKTDAAVSVNGGAALKAPSGTVYFAKTGNAWAISKEQYPQGLIKKHALSGPVLDVFMGEPVLMVYGSAGGKDQAANTAMVDSAVKAFFGPGDGGAMLHTNFEQKADSAVSKDDIANKNLVLFGTPKENSILRDIAAKLPVKFSDGGFEIAGKSYKEPDSLMMVYPNPLNPQRYILIVPESFSTCNAQTILDVDGFGDYVVGKPKPGFGGTRFAIEAEGLFDSNWANPAAKPGATK